MIAAQSEHGKGITGAVGTEQELHAGDGRGHRGQITQLVDVQESGGGVVHGLFRAGNVGNGIGSRRRSPLRDLHGVERNRRRRHAGIGDQNFLIGGAFHLVSPGPESDRREGHPVVAFAAGEGDRVATILVGACRAADVPAERGRGDQYVGNGLHIYAKHPAADDIDCLGGQLQAAHDEQSDGAKEPIENFGGMGHNDVDEETGPALSADLGRHVSAKCDVGLPAPITRSPEISLTTPLRPSWAW